MKMLLWIKKKDRGRKKKEYVETVPLRQVQEEINHRDSSLNASNSATSSSSSSLGYPNSTLMTSLNDIYKKYNYYV